MKTVFFSYRNNDPRATTEVDEIKKELAARAPKLRLLAEDDKSVGPDNFSEELYRQLNGADAVISVLFPDSMNSDWIKFEAWTARLQIKWYPVVYGAVTFHSALVGPKIWDGAEFKDLTKRDAAFERFARAIEKNADARVYRTKTASQQTRSRIVAIIVGFFGLLGAAFTLMSGFKSAICSNMYGRAVCDFVGYRTPP